MRQHVGVFVRIHEGNGSLAEGTSAEVFGRGHFMWHAHGDGGPPLGSFDLNHLRTAECVMSQMPLMTLPITSNGIFNATLAACLANSREKRARLRSFSVVNCFTCTGGTRVWEGCVLSYISL